MKIKLLFTIIAVSIGSAVMAQGGWTHKINFSSTAKIAGKVSIAAGKLGASAPGLIGTTARFVSASTRAISSGSVKNKKSSVKSN